MIATLFVARVVLLALGVPVAFALGGATLAAMLVNGSLPLLALPKYLFSGIDIFALEAVPFFILDRRADDRRRRCRRCCCASRRSSSGASAAASATPTS